jgi:hypothetical protein
MVTHAYSQHSGGGDRKITSSRPAWATQGDPVSKKKKESNDFE